eukprot:10348927-Heterocapsa_arctica.AAC.1
MVPGHPVGWLGFYETLGGGVPVQQLDKEERPYGGTSSARQAVAMLLRRLLAGNYRRTCRSRLNSRPNKHRRRLPTWNYRTGFQFKL